MNEPTETPDPNALEVDALLRAAAEATEAPPQAPGDAEAARAVVSKLEASERRRRTGAIVGTTFALAASTLLFVGVGDFARGGGGLSEGELASFRATEPGHRGAVRGADSSAGALRAESLTARERERDVSEDATAEPSPTAIDEEGTEPTLGAETAEDAGVFKSQRRPPAPSLETLLQRARAASGRGDFPEAARLYERALRAPELRGAKGKVAIHLSLGDLYLARLNKAQRALRHFRAAAKQGGALQAEAAYGEIRALKALGRTDAARDASAAFVAKFPNSHYRRSL